MANSNSPFGFKFLRSLDGENKLNARGKYTIASAYGSKITRGEAVVLAGAGSSVAGHVDGITIARGAGTSEQVIGVFDSCSYIDSTGKRFDNVHYWPASQTLLSGTACTVNVYDVTGSLFLVQGDSGSWVAADIGLNVDYTPGTASGAKAQSVITRTGINTTDTLMCRLVSFAPENLLVDGTNELGAYAKFVVQFNANAYTTRTGA